MQIEISKLSESNHFDYEDAMNMNIDIIMREFSF